MQEQTPCTIRDFPCFYNICIWFSYNFSKNNVFILWKNMTLCMQSRHTYNSACARIQACACKHKLLFYTDWFLVLIEQKVK